ncbi:MAG: hypothetical protein M3071_24065 [Actinomycetota bacterium]|nr:hypothetical protein [Actinomycetota bacterium]
MPAPPNRRLAIALAGAGCALAVAACGGSSSKHAARSDSQLALSQCMRAHGVPNYPDPTRGPGGEGFSITASPGSSAITVDGITFDGPVFLSAERTCKLSGSGSGPPPISESQKVALFHFAQCMRAHGVPSYPDPVFPAGGGIEQGSTPGLSRNSPAVRHAATVCNRG